MLQLVAGLGLSPWLLACATAPAPALTVPVAEVAELAPTQRACPSGLPADTRCLGGQDSAGAFYLIAMPQAWTGVLVLHAHGGPELGAPKLERSAEDLTRWAIMVKAGHAWAGSTFRQGGVAVRAAAEDTERLRQIFVAHVAKPERTILHGQSWGAGVAAKAAEMYAGTDPGAGVGADRLTPAYDGVLLSSGVLAGGTRSYDFRLDLRVVYQYLCANHPLPQEPQYPLWMGLPSGSALTRADLAQRADACLGLRQPVAQRSAEQQQRLQTLLRVIRIPERSVLGHLNWATWHFQEVVQKRTGGLNPWGNIGAQYSGSADDVALNAAVLRYRADPAAVASFGRDSDPTGRIRVPVLGVHAVHDPVAFVELEAQFRRTMQAAGQAGHQVQTFTDDHEHSYLSDPVYPALIDELLAWTQSAARQPTPQSVAARCQALQARFGPGCRFLPDYQPAELETRVVPRQRP
jgi:pimeloyl-ACP methyl ester carboxylesterase